MNIDDDERPKVPKRGSKRKCGLKLGVGVRFRSLERADRRRIETYISQAGK